MTKKVRLKNTGDDSLVVIVSDEEAKKLVSGGGGEYVGKPPKREFETATEVPASEHAVTRSKKKKKR